MAPWRTARSLDTLLAEINNRSPKRSKISDGALGDAAHASRDSDHNPWVKDGTIGVVTARDFTNDPGDGFDSSDFAEWLRKRCKAGDETRVKYINSDRRICSAKESWAWRAYSGPNAHMQHVHISVHSGRSQYDSTKPWGWEAAGKPAKPAAPVAEKDDDMTPEELLGHKLKLGESAAANMSQPGYTKRKVNDPYSIESLLLWGGPGLYRLQGDLDRAAGDVRDVKTAQAALTGQVAELRANADTNHTTVTLALGELARALAELKTQLSASPEA